MEELRARIIVGGSVTDEDLAALRRAAAGDGQVRLNTEYGPWPLRITRADVAAGSFHLVSLPPGSAP